MKYHWKMYLSDANMIGRLIRAEPASENERRFYYEKAGKALETTVSERSNIQIRAHLA